MLQTKVWPMICGLPTLIMCLFDCSSCSSNNIITYGVISFTLFGYGRVDSMEVLSKLHSCLPQTETTHWNQHQHHVTLYDLYAFKLFTGVWTNWSSLIDINTWFCLFFCLYWFMYFVSIRLKSRWSFIGHKPKLEDIHSSLNYFAHNAFPGIKQIRI